MRFLSIVWDSDLNIGRLENAAKNVLHIPSSFGFTLNSCTCFHAEEILYLVMVKGMDKIRILHNEMKLPSFEDMWNLLISSIGPIRYFVNLNFYHYLFS